MSEKKSHVSMSQGFEVEQPAKGRAYIIPVLEWNHLKEKVHRIETAGLGFHTTGSILAGVAATTLGAALTIPQGSTLVGISSTLVSWAICIASAVCGGMALYFASRQRELISHTKQEVIIEMEQIEKRYGQGEHIVQ